MSESLDRITPPPPHRPSLSTAFERCSANDGRSSPSPGGDPGGSAGSPRGLGPHIVHLFNYMTSAYTLNARLYTGPTSTGSIRASLSLVLSLSLSLFRYSVLLRLFSSSTRLSLSFHSNGRKQCTNHRPRIRVVITMYGESSSFISSTVLIIDYICQVLGLPRVRHLM